MAKIWVGRTALHGEKRGDGLSTENKVLERVEVFKLLGVQVQRDLKQIEQFIDDIAARANKQLYFLCVCHKANLPTEVGLATYISPRYAHFWSILSPFGVVFPSIWLTTCSGFKIAQWTSLASLDTL